MYIHISEGGGEITNTKPRTCAACQENITDRFLLKINDVFWHEHCLKCCYCGNVLDNGCFYKDGRTFCKNDYLR